MVAWVQVHRCRGTRDRFALALACCAGLALFLAGCGRRETLVQRGDRAGILERGAGADVADLDPQTAVRITEMDVDSSLFEGLVAEDPVDLHPVPGAADRWEISPDGITYTFHLRPDARWSDGRPLTAADFVASWQRILSPKFAAENVELLYLLRGAKKYHRGLEPDFRKVGVTAVDSQTLRVELEHPAPYFLSLLSLPAWFPVPIATIARYGDIADRSNRWTQAGHLVGNGPFVLQHWHANEEIYVEKSPTYWDAARVRLNAIRFHLIDNVDAEERAFRAGQLHVTYALPFGKAETYRRDAPQFLRSDPYLDTYFLRLNTQRAPLNDERVRRALALAIDRTTLVENVLRHAGQRPATAITPPGIPSYVPPEGLGLNIAEAQRLLAAAGYPRGKGFPPLELLFNTSPNHRTTAEALQEMWRRNLGIEVQLVNQEYKVVLSEREAGQYQIVFGDWVGDFLDPLTFLDPWRSTSPNNHTGWRSSDYDALLAAASQNTDALGRDRELRQAETLLLDAAPIVPLYYNPHTYLLRPSVQGWYPTLLDHHPYKSVGLKP